MNEFGKVMFVFGVVIAVIGLLLWTGVGKGWLGKLPRGHQLLTGQF